MQRAESVLRGLGRPPGVIHAAAQQQMHQQFIRQASVLAYNDCFLLFSIIAFAVVPFCFLLKPTVSGAKQGGD
jgi:DHA2 family multidrug resistance protein